MRGARIPKKVFSPYLYLLYSLEKTDDFSKNIARILDYRYILYLKNIYIYDKIKLNDYTGL